MISPTLDLIRKNVRVAAKTGQGNVITDEGVVDAVMASTPLDEPTAPIFIMVRLNGTWHGITPADCPHLSEAAPWIITGVDDA